MIGIIPAAGAAERIQPLGCSKELLPVGARTVAGLERPKAVAEYLVERMIAAGASHICMVISPHKTDIVKYFAARDYAAEIFYVVQPAPRGLCDAIFRAEPFTGGYGPVLIGLPDTLWFPEDAYRAALAYSKHENGQAESDSIGVNLVLFPVANPSLFDAVICDELGYVRRVEVKQPEAHSNWIWGAATASSEALRALKLLWEARHRQDQYVGDLLNAYIAQGNPVRATFSGEIYMDLGTLEGYRAAQDFLRSLPAAVSVVNMK